jgi:hypothetical protein
MIVRAKTVTAVLERKTLKQLNSSTEITLRLADNIGLISKNVSQMPYLLRTYSIFKLTLATLQKELKTKGKPLI